MNFPLSSIKIPENIEWPTEKFPIKCLLTTNFLPFLGYKRACIVESFVSHNLQSFFKKIEIQLTIAIAEVWHSSWRHNNHIQQIIVCRLHDSVYGIRRGDDCPSQGKSGHKYVDFLETTKPRNVVQKHHIHYLHKNCYLPVRVSKWQQISTWFLFT